MQRSANDVGEALDSLNAQRSLLVGNSCAGQILTLFASQHSDRLSGLVYLDGASDPTTPAYGPTGIRVPVLAIYQAQLPFEEVAKEFDIRNEEECAALRQYYAATRAMYTRWPQHLLAAIPMARIVELPGANLYMFLSNEADTIRELRAFASTL